MGKSSVPIDDFFTSAQENEIVEAIRRAERETSGEVRVHIEDGDPSVEVLDRAAEVFNLLGMTQTALKNGVLLYLDITHHRFAIWGGQGIYEVVPHDFWDATYAAAIGLFRQGKITEGLCAAIEQVGIELREFFPYSQDDVNELPDEISKGRI